MPRKSLVSLLPPFHECLMDRLHLSPKVICRPQSSSLSRLSSVSLDVNFYRAETPIGKSSLTKNDTQSFVFRRVIASWRQPAILMADKNVKNK